MSMTLGEALAAAGSADWSTRVVAARQLVSWVGDDEVDAALIRLLGDPDNTAPVTAAAAALLDRQTPASLRLFALGWDQVDDECRDHMADELRAALGSGSLSRECLERLLDADEAGVCAGALSIARWSGWISSLGSEVDT